MMKENLKCLNRLIAYGFVEAVSPNSRAQYLKFLERETKTVAQLWNPIANIGPKLSVSVNGELAGFVDLFEFTEENMSKFIPAHAAQELMQQFTRSGKGTVVMPGLIKEWPWHPNKRDLTEIGLTAEYGDVRIIFRSKKWRCCVVVRNAAMYASYFPEDLRTVATDMEQKFSTNKIKNIYHAIL